MVDKLRLEVILAAVDKVTGPLKTISAGSKATAAAIGEAETAIKKLESQQRKMTRLQDATPAMGAARNAMRVAQTNLAGLKASGTATAKQIAAQERAVEKQTAAYERQRNIVLRLRSEVSAMGLGNVNQAQQRLASSIQTTNAQIDAQRRKLELQQQTEQRLATLREKHSKAMVKMGMWGATGAGMMMAGAKVRTPLQSAVNAFMPAEDAEAQLGASLMRADGTVPESMQKMLELSTRLGDKLPGNTKDFTELMQALSQEGLSDKTILGGTAEAAAYLAVQLKKVPKEAATMAAKMQDATRATESEMMGILDMVQRGHYAGADADYMLSGFTKLSPVLDITRKKGMEVMNALSPMMVMMNQAGMVDGASAGNAIRKVFQFSMDAKKLGKANAALRGAGAGFKLDFSDGKGEFGGIDQMFDQLTKLQKLTTMQRGGVIKELFGDDAETLQVVNTLMNKGVAGYAEAAKKLTEQASLQQRVNEQLKTLSNSAEAAEGSFTNMLAALGKSIAPELKVLLGWLGSMANATGSWARENPRLTKAIMLTVAGVAALLSVTGALVIGIVAVLGPLHMARFLLSRWLLGMVASKAATMGMAAVVGGRLVGALRMAGAAVATLGRALLFTPLGRALSLLTLSATMVYRNWDGIKGGLVAIWEGITGRVSEAISGGVTKWLALLADFSPVGILYSVVAFALDTLGITLPNRFSTLGGQMLDGLVNGITSRVQAVRNAIGAVTDGAQAWFKEKLGIHSPSRVFMTLGGHVGEGAALGILNSADMVRKAALGMAAATLVPMAAMATPPEMELNSAGQMARVLQAPQVAPVAKMAPMAARQTPSMAAPMASSASTYQITINPTPGMDPQAIARAVAAELDRRESAQNSRRLSRLSDID